MKNRNSPAYPNYTPDGDTKKEGLSKLEYLALEIYKENCLGESAIKPEDAMRLANKFFDVIDFSPEDSIMTGLKHIIHERERQISVHGFDIEGDKLRYQNDCENDLINLAIFCLTLEDQYFPISMSKQYKEKILKKESIIDRYAVAGALIAAQIDKLLL